MAKQPPRDDDQAQKPAGAHPELPGANPSRLPGQPPTPAIPNMEIDEPEEAALDVEEIFEDDVPVVEAAPASDVAAFVLSEDDVMAEEVVEATPESAVVEVLPEDEMLAEEIVEEAPPSEVDLMKMFEETPAATAQAAAAAHEMEDDPLSVFADEPAAAAQAGPTTPSFPEAWAPAATPVEIHKPPIVQETPPSAAEPSMRMDELASVAVPASEPPVHDGVFEEPLVEAAPLSDVAVAEEIAEAAPVSDVQASEEVLEEPIAEAAPASEVVASGEPVHIAPRSEVVASPEQVHTAPLSDVAASQEIVEPAPGSAVVASEPVAAHAHASDVLASEGVEELVEPMPESAIVASEEVEEVFEAMPASAVVAAEEFEEVVEANRASDVLFDEVVAEAGPASEAKSAEVAEELIEAMDEPSSATRRAEAVLEDEVADAEVASGAEIFDATEMVEPMPVSAVAEDAVLDAEEVEAAETGSSAVLFDEGVEEASAVKPGADFDNTMAFERASSAAKKADDDALVTEEEFSGTSEASAVDLGDMPAPKGSSVNGIDKVAEALESGVDLDGDANDALAKTVPSVEFDELLDELDEVEAKPARKKPVAKEESTEMDADAIAEEVQAYEEETVSKKGAKDKKKPKSVATGDDLDLGELFDADAEEPEEAEEALDGEGVSEAEEAEASDAEEAAEAEAAEAFDEEMDATEALDAEAFDDEDEKPTKKKGKKSRVQEDDEEAAAVADEDEDFNPKKKGKKEKATVGSAPAQTSTFLRVFIGMVLAGIILVGAAAAGLFFAPEHVRDLANEIDPPKPLPKPPEKTKLELAHVEMDKLNYEGALTQLAAATNDDEFSVRGEARWLKYLQKVGDGVPDAADPEVDTALKDLNKGKDKVLLAHVKLTLAAKTLRDDMTKAKADKETVDKDLTDMTAKRDAADKKLDAAAGVLVKDKYLDDKAEFTEVALAKILKGLGDDRKSLADVNEVLKDAEIKGLNADGVKEVLKIKQGLEANITAVEKVLENEKTKGKGDKGVLEIVDARNKMTKDRDALLDTVAAAFKEFVDGKIVPADADPRKQIVAGAKLARQKAESPLSIPLAQLGMSLGSIGTGTSKVVEQTFNTAKLASELSWFNSREKFIETPQQKMNTYITLLQDRGQNDAKHLAGIRREADWVRAPESKSDNEAQAKARYVQGLALRNQEKFAEAKTAFADTLKMTMGIKSDWGEWARKSQRELADPNEYYLPRMRTFLAAGNPGAALSEADTALKAIPNDARLFAQRGLIRYELIRGKGPKVPDEAQKDIRADAKAAEKDDTLAAESAYIVGLLEEELTHWIEAEKQYRQAIKLHEDGKALPNEGGKYRVALARLLLRDRDETPVGPAPAPGDDEKKKKDDKAGAAAAPEERTLVMHPWSLLVVTSVIAQPVEEVDDPAAVARYKEAAEQAHKLIASGDKDLKGAGYLALGKALSKMGRRTEGLKAYAEGLRLIHPGMSTKELKDLIDQHPAFQQPDVSDTPNPLMSERHFGEGMHLYWSKKYPEAEAQFRQAVKYFDKDARYQYFLGLAQLHQKTLRKRDAAIYSFETGARLEAKAAQSNPDAVRDINASLERIQGELRQHLNGFRYKAMSTEPEDKK